MATPIITPPAAAPAPSTPTPSPASAPATPAVSTPTPGPASPAAQPTFPAAPDTRSIRERLAEGWDKAKATVATETAAEPVAALPETQPAAADEVPAEGVEPVVAETVAETAAEPEAAPVAATEELPALDDGLSLDPQAWDSMVGETPALKEFFEQHPEERSQIMGALRRDGENREIRQLFPTKEAASEAAKGFGLYQNLDNRFLAATDKKGAGEFLSEWVKQAMVTDDAGKPVLGADGKYQFHPALFNTMNHILDNRLDVLAENAKTSGDERLQAAVDYIREVTQGPSSPAAGEVPEELKPFADSVKSREEKVAQREEALTRQQREAKEQENQQAVASAENKVYDTLSAQLKPITAKAGLSKFELGAAMEKIGSMLEDKLSQHPMYSSVRASILSQPHSEARSKALIKHDLTYMQEMLGPIAAQVIREAKGGAIDRQTARQAKVTAQQHQSRTEPRGTSVVSPSTKTQSPAELRSSIVNEYKAAHQGADPDPSFVRTEIFKRSMRSELRR